MTKRRWLGLVAATGGTLALSAPAAQATVDTTLTFGAGTVHVVDTGPTADTVRFTMAVANPATTRLFIDIKGKGEGYITLGSQAALGVAHAVYNQVSTPSCQVYTGTTFGEADAVPTTDGTIAFDIRKDELAPSIALLMEDSAGGPADCKGFDGVSNGRPISFATGGGQTVTPLDWVAPANPTNLRAVGTPHAITLFWTPPADAVGVRYQVVEDGLVNPVSESVTGNAATFSGLVPGSVHTYHLRAYRFWGDRLFAPAFTAGATAVATEFAPPAAAPAATATAAKQAVKGTTKRKGATARPAAPKAFRAKVTRGRVLITLPKLAKGERVEIQRSAATKKAKFARIATSKAKTYLDRTVRRGRTYRYRLVLVTSDGRRSLPSKTLTVRVPRR
jgi:hypothetical protein